MLGFVGTFASLNDIFPCEWKILFKLLLSLGILCGTWGISFVACAVWFSNKNEYLYLKQTMDAMYMWNMEIYYPTILLKPPNQEETLLLVLINVLTRL